MLKLYTQLKKEISVKVDLRYSYKDTQDAKDTSSKIKQTLLKYKLSKVEEHSGYAYGAKYIAVCCQGQINLYNTERLIKSLDAISVDSNLVYDPKKSRFYLYA